jgi:hypothetical protein
MPIETSKDLVLATDSMTVNNGGKWVKFEKVEGSESLSSIRVRIRKKKTLPHAEV